MKLIFKKSMTEKLSEAIHEAMREKKIIEKILLTTRELNDLEDENTFTLPYYKNRMTSFMGIPIEREER